MIMHMKILFSMTSALSIFGYFAISVHPYRCEFKADYQVLFTHMYQIIHIIYKMLKLMFKKNCANDYKYAK